MSKKSTFMAGMLALAYACSYAAPATAPVTEQPQGTELWFSQQSIAYSVSGWGFIDYNMQDGFAKKVVVSEDGKTVWFRNPISMLPTGTWVEGTIDGDIITLPMDQVIQITEDKNGAENVWTIGALKSERVEDPELGEVTQWTSSGLDNLTFTYKDGAIEQNEKGIMLALLCNGEYQIYGDVNIRMKEVDPTSAAAKFPEDADVQKWTFCYGNTLLDGYTVDAVVDGNDVYVRGFWTEQPNATIKGTLEDGVLTFPAGQYLGFINSNGLDYFIYFMTCKNGTPGIMQYYQPLDEALAYTLDDATGKFTQVENVSGEPLKIMVKGGCYTDFELTTSVAFLLINNPTLKMQADAYGVPQAPVLDPNYCYKYFSAGFTQLEFYIRPFDEDGNVLDKSDLTYSVWVDDEKVYFDADDFANWDKLPEPGYEMPLDFRNNWGIMYDDNLCNRRVQVPFARPEKLGAQVIFTDPVTGERKASQIAYYYPDTKEVKYEDEVGTSVDAIEAEAVSVEYIDLLGQRVADNYKGVCVKVAKYADGSVKSVKVVR